MVKIGDLLARRGVLVAHRTLHRYCVERTDYRGRGARETVPVADGEPGVECQIDFARMGLIDRPGDRAAPGGARVDLHRGVFAAHVRVVDVRDRRWRRSSPAARRRGGSSAACSRSSSRIT